MQKETAMPTLEELNEAARPLIDFLHKYYHPHARVIVEYGSAEVNEGIMAVPFEVPD